MIKGLFIEDDANDFASYKAAFELNNILLQELPSFPERIDEIYELVLTQDVDFIIIDNHLDKKTSSYNGIDILVEIRKNDPEIYVVYLTSKDFDMEKLSKFDQAIKKESFAREKTIIIERIVRAVSRDVSVKLEREIENNAQRQQEFLDKQLELLSQLLSRVSIEE